MITSAPLKTQWLDTYDSVWSNPDESFAKMGKDAGETLRWLIETEEALRKAGKVTDQDIDDLGCKGLMFIIEPDGRARLQSPRILPATR